MPATVAESPKPAVAKVSDEELIAMKYPCLPGQIQRINRLFEHDGATFYRMNIVDEYSGYTVESHFLKVRKGRIEEKDEGDI